MCAGEREVCAGERKEGRKRRKKKRYSLIIESKELLEMLLNLKTFSLLAAHYCILNNFILKNAKKKCSIGFFFYFVTRSTYLLVATEIG